MANSSIIWDRGYGPLTRQADAPPPPMLWIVLTRPLSSIALVASWWARSIRIISHGARSTRELLFTTESASSISNASFCRRIHFRGSARFNSGGCRKGAATLQTVLLSTAVNFHWVLIIVLPRRRVGRMGVTGRWRSRIARGYPRQGIVTGVY